MLNTPALPRVPPSRPRADRAFRRVLPLNPVLDERTAAVEVQCVRAEQRRELVYQYLVDCIEIQGGVATQRTMADDLQLSTSTVRRHCLLLAAEGRIAVTGRGRAYRLPGGEAAEVLHAARTSGARGCPACGRNNALAHAIRAGALVVICQWWTHGCQYQSLPEIGADWGAEGSRPSGAPPAA